MRDDLATRVNAYTLGLPATLGAILVLCILVLLGFSHVATPSPVAASAPAQVFSAERAAVTLGQIARQPHATGTLENTRVRNHLLDALRQLGYAPEVQSGIGQSRDHQAMALVHNIVVRLPGSKPGKAVLLAAHYDSAPISPGAADDGASVAAILETLRALKSAPPLQNDLVCVLTDGEEIGLLGARLFMQEHRFAKSIGIAINFENRGNRGPVWMFETGDGNAKVIDGFARSAPHPLGNSLLNEIYKTMPNDTDLTIFKRAGVPALNFAAAEGYMSYHTPLDRAEAVDPGTLQHAGDTMLSLVRHFGNAPIGDLRAQDGIYADLPIAGMVSYSGYWLWLLPALSASLWMGACVAARRRHAAGIGRVLLGVPVFLSLLAVLALVCQLAWRAVLLAHPEYQLLLHGSTYNSNWYWSFFIALSLGLFLAAQRWLARWLLPLELGLAAALVWVAALAGVSLAVPGASFLLAWPLLPVLLALIVFLLRPGRPFSGYPLLVLLLGVAPGCIILPPILDLIYNALTARQVWVAVLLLGLFLGLAAPLLSVLAERPAVRRVPLLVAVLSLAGAALHAGFDRQQPRPNNLYYVQPSGGAPALWASTDAGLDAWTQSFFQGEKAKRNESAVFGQTAAPQWLASAPAFGIEAPRIEVAADQLSGNTRAVTLAITSTRRAPRMDIAVDGVKVLRAHVQGKPYLPKSGENWKLQSYGMQAERLLVELEMAPGQAFRVWARDYSYGLPAAARPRPAEMMGQPFGDSDTTQAVNSLLVQ